MRPLQPKNWEDQPRPMLKASNIHYEMAGRTAAMNCGGIGAMHLMVQRLGLVEDIDKNLQHSRACRNASPKPGSNGMLG
jgi:hypothetical protein